MNIYCPNCGEIIPIDTGGREKLDISVNMVLDTLRACYSVASAARILDCSRGSIYNILSDEKLSPKDFLKKSKMVRINA